MRKRFCRFLAAWLASALLAVLSSISLAPAFILAAPPPDTPLAILPFTVTARSGLFDEIESRLSPNGQ